PCPLAGSIGHYPREEVRSGWWCRGRCTARRWLSLCGLGEVRCPPAAAALQSGLLATVSHSGEESLVMASEGSVTRWLPLLQAGDPAAVQQLWERYFRRLVGLARLKLRGAPCCAAYEEDVALSAFATFVRHAERGRFPALADRDGLWRLLVTITVRKA